MKVLLSFLQKREHELRQFIESPLNTPEQRQNAESTLMQVLKAIREDVVEIQRLEDESEDG